MAKQGIDFESFLSTIPDDMEGINKEVLRKKFKSLDGDLEGQLAFMEELYAQAQARAKDILKRRTREESKKERKERNHRLITLGAIVESILGTNYDPNVLREQLMLLKKPPGDEREALWPIIGQCLENCIKRPLEPADIQKFINYLSYEQRQGKYITNWMNKRY